jgi:S-adenosylmethionine hydrolase
VAGNLQGSVVRISDEGDLVTDISSEQLVHAPRDSSVQILVDDEHETFGLFGSDHDQPAMTLIAICDDGEALRLHLVGDSASMMLGVRSGAPVKVKWI